MPELGGKGMVFWYPLRVCEDTLTVVSMSLEIGMSAVKLTSWRS